LDSNKDRPSAVEPLEEALGVRVGFFFFEYSISATAYERSQSGVRACYPLCDGAGSGL